LIKLTKTELIEDPKKEENENEENDEDGSPLK